MSDVQADWAQARLNDIADIGTGVTLGRELGVANSIELPYLRVANVQDGYIDTDDVKTVRVLPSELSRYRLRKGDILLTEGGDFDKLGRGAIWDGSILNCLHQNHVFRVRVKDGMVPGFFAAYMASDNGRDYFLSCAKQTTNLASINKSQLSAMPVPVPSEKEQRRIAEILDAADSHMTILGRLLHKQDSLRDSLLCSLIPVSPDPQGLGGDWGLAPLAEVVPSANYGISSPLASDGNGIPTLRMNNLAFGGIRIDDIKFATVRVPGDLILRERDVLFNRTNSFEHVGRTAIWRGELDQATFASYLVRLNPDLRRLMPEYLVRWLNHPAIQQRIRRIATPGVQQVNINPTSLRKIPIELPVYISRQAEIVQILDECDRVADRIRAELGRLVLLKRGLMDDLLTGRVPVSSVSL